MAVITSCYKLTVTRWGLGSGDRTATCRLGGLALRVSVHLPAPGGPLCTAPAQRGVWPVPDARAGVGGHLSRAALWDMRVVARYQPNPCSPRAAGTLSSECGRTGAPVLCAWTRPSVGGCPATHSTKERDGCVPVTLAAVTAFPRWTRTSVRVDCHPLRGEAGERLLGSPFRPPRAFRSAGATGHLQTRADRAAGSSRSAWGVTVVQVPQASRVPFCNMSLVRILKWRFRPILDRDTFSQGKRIFFPSQTVTVNHSLH